MKKNASIQLGINFIVVMILSIVILGLGLGIMTKATSTASQWDAQVSKINQERLAKNLNNGELTSVFPRVQTVDRGDLARFAIGINNELPSTTGSTDFYIELELDKAQGGEAPNILYVKGPFTIKHNERRIDIGVGIEVSKKTKSGEWIYNVNICKNTECDEAKTNRYSKIQKLQVNVN